MGKLWRILSSPGVVWWGMPTALMTTYLRVRREGGWSWGVLKAGGFWIELVIALLVTGILGGLAFEWTMRKTGTPLGLPHSRKDHDRTA